MILSTLGHLTKSDLSKRLISRTIFSTPPSILNTHETLPILSQSERHLCTKRITNLSISRIFFLGPTDAIGARDQFSWNTSLIQKKHLSSPPQRRNAKKTKPLMNEALVNILKRRKGSDDIEVRVVTDLGRDVPSEVAVFSLKAALEHSKSLKIDLMEIDLKQTPPVLKATDYGRLVYDMKKKQKAAQQSGAGNKQLATKEYKFKAGISDHDLERKVENMKSYLMKGHSCKVTITARAFLTRQNHNIAIETLARVRELVSDDIMESGKVRQSNPKHLSILLQPKRQ